MTQLEDRPTRRALRMPHRAWIIAGAAFVILIGAAGFRAVPSVLIDPLHEEFGWSRATIASAVSINLVLYGLFSPFAAALMDRLGMRRVVVCALIMVAAGSGLTVFMTSSWQLLMCWGVLVGVGTGSMAMTFVATVTGRWFVKHRGLVSGVLTAAGATGQLIFLPLVAALATEHGWRTPALVVSACALAVVPLVLLCLRDYPRDVGLTAYGARGDSAEFKCAGRSWKHYFCGSAGGWHTPTPRAGLRPALGAGRPAQARPAGRAGGRGCRRPCPAGAPRGLPHLHLLAARRWLRDLRHVHQRPGRHALRHGSARPRHAAHHRRVAAGRGRHLRRGRHDPVRLAHRPGRPAPAARRLLHLPRAVAADPAGAVRPGRPAEHVGVHRVLDWIATVPPTVALCRDRYGADGPVVFGWVFASHQIGAAIAAVGAGSIRDTLGDYQLAWYLAGALCVVAALMSVSIRSTRTPETSR